MRAEDRCRAAAALLRTAFARRAERGFGQAAFRDLVSAALETLELADDAPMPKIDGLTGGVAVIWDVLQQDPEALREALCLGASLPDPEGSVFSRLCLVASCWVAHRPTPEAAPRAFRYRLTGEVLAEVYTHAEITTMRPAGLAEDAINVEVTGNVTWRARIFDGSPDGDRVVSGCERPEQAIERVDEILRSAGWRLGDRATPILLTPSAGHDTK